MTFGQILLTLFGIGISLFFIIYYVSYRCFPWQKEMHAIVKNYSWGDSNTASFRQQYSWHKANHSLWRIDGETTSLSFKSFKTFYELNSKAWRFQEDSFGDRSMYFQIVYQDKEKNKAIRIVFNKNDFQKYRKWLVSHRKVKNQNIANKKMERDVANCQIILDSIKRDVEKTINLANEEIQKAQEINNQVKENLTQPTKKAVLTVKPHIEFDEKTQTLKYVNYDRNIYQIIGKGEWKDEAVD